MTVPPEQSGGQNSAYRSGCHKQRTYSHLIAVFVQRFQAAPTIRMAAHSLSQTKNYIRKALWKAVDPAPSATQIHCLWTYFESNCAYCGLQLNKAERKAHLDHLDATGRNHISNRVLACGVCNGDEKREQNWEAFLAKKCGTDVQLFQTRRKRILDWKQQCERLPEIDEHVAAQVEESIARCHKVLEDSYQRMRLFLAEQKRLK